MHLLSDKMMPDPEQESQLSCYGPQHVVQLVKQLSFLIVISFIPQ